MSGRHGHGHGHGHGHAHRHRCGRRSRRAHEPTFEVWIPQLDAFVRFRSRRAYRDAVQDGSLGDFVDDVNAGRVRGRVAGTVADRQAVAAAADRGRPVGGGPVFPGTGAQQLQRVLARLEGQQRSIDNLVEITQGIGRLYLEDHRDRNGEAEEGGEEDGGGGVEQAP